MISGINLVSFKAFEELEVEFAPITLILGPNNSGKSSILAPLRILVQTIESFDSRISLLLNGIMGDFGTFKDVVYSGHGRTRRIMQIGISIKRANRQRSFDQKGRLAAEHSGEEISLLLDYRYRPRRREVALRSTEMNTNNSLLFSTKFSEDTERQIVERIGLKEVPPELKGTLSKRLRFRNFLPWYYLVRRSEEKDSPLEEFLDAQTQDDLRLISSVARRIDEEIRSIEYIGAMREPPSRTYIFSGERRQRVGPKGEYAANLLTMDYFRGGQKSREIAEKITKWMSKAGIGSDIEPELVSDRYYEIYIQHPVTHEYQNLADVGRGNSQVLPVLVGGYNLAPGSTYIVEEPEIHLHPRAQSELGSFFHELYERDVQSIVETHSEHLVISLQQLVASGSIPPEHVRVYYVYAEDERKKVRPLNMDEDGYFTEEWPEGFFSERLEEAKKLARIRYRKETGQGE